MDNQDAEKTVAGKSNDELLAMLAQPAVWQPDILEAARAQLRKRGVELSATNPPSLPVPAPPIPTFAQAQGWTSFPVVAVILLHYVTCGIFPLIWLNLMHGKLPRVRADDPSAGKAIGFCFIPFFNLYWIFFTYRRLCLR